MYYLGVDPGKSGAYAVLDETNRIVLASLFTDFHEAAARLRDQPLFCALEKVHSMPRQGVVSTFTFAENFGAWQGLLIGLGVTHILVTPQRWQKALLDFQITTEPKIKGEDAKAGATRLARNRATLKAAIVSFVKRRIPDAASHIVLKKHFDIADALCLALYAKNIATPSF